MYYIARVSGYVQYDESVEHNIINVISSTKKAVIEKAFEDYKNIDEKDDYGCGCCYCYYVIREGK